MLFRSNTSLLIEIAKKKGNYVPDLSFGTHFFQDLVESSIRYLPLYPDDEGIIFNESFLLESENLLPRMLHEYSYLSNTIKVINITQATKGLVLRVLMNADEDEAIGVFLNPTSKSIYRKDYNVNDDNSYLEPWEWRLRVVENIASNLNTKRFGVKSMFLFGTSFGKSATVDSDIDLLIHFNGTEKQKEQLLLWFEGWNLSLIETYYIQTGFRMKKLLDVHFVTDGDMKQKKYYSDIIEQKNSNSIKLNLSIE